MLPANISTPALRPFAGCVQSYCPRVCVAFPVSSRINNTVSLNLICREIYTCVRKASLGGKGVCTKWRGMTHPWLRWRVGKHGISSCLPRMKVVEPLQAATSTKSRGASGAPFLMLQGPIPGASGAPSLDPSLAPGLRCSQGAGPREQGGLGLTPPSAEQGTSLPKTAASLQAGAGSAVSCGHIKGEAMLEAQTGAPHAEVPVHGQAGRALTGLWKPDKVRPDSSRGRFAAAGARLECSWPSRRAPAAAASSPDSSLVSVPSASLGSHSSSSSPHPAATSAGSFGCKQGLRPCCKCLAPAGRGCLSASKPA